MTRPKLKIGFCTDHGVKIANVCACVYDTDTLKGFQAITPEAKKAMCGFCTKWRAPNA